MDFMKELEAVMPIVCTIAAVVFLVAIVSFCLRVSGIYIAFIAVLGGSLGIIFSFVDLDHTVVKKCAYLLAVFAGLVYLLLISLLALRRLRIERKRRRQEIARRLQYTLPQRENTYIRTRLNTALRTSEVGENELQLAVQLGYTHDLLGKLRAAPLSVAERLQTEEMGKLLNLYKGKENWTVHELNGLNDVCAALLKLSAKYAV